MTGEDTIKNIFTGDGTSQDQRSLPALSPDYAKMDDRGIGEMLDLICKYAAYVFYYSGKDYANPEGDWQRFFRDNPPFQYAVIQQFEAGKLESAYNEARDLFTLRITGGSFWPLFNRIMAVALQLNTWQQQLDNTSSLSRVLQTLIASDLSKALARLIGVSHTFTIRQNDFANDLDDLVSNEKWGLTLEKLLATDSRLAKFDPASRRKEVETLAELDNIFQIFFKGVREVQQYARDHFEESLSGTGYEEPHLGLLYTFLQLFIKVRDGKKGLNDITGRHLDFFFKDVLGLTYTPHLPDHVHILVELAKQVNFSLLEKDTALKAGKDKKGKEISFLLENETIFNKAVAEQQRTLFKDAKATLYAAPVANSADGLGTAFQGALDNSWPILGSDKYPFARTGLVLSSNVLLLREGNREIFLSIDLNNLNLTATEENTLKDLFTEPSFLINASTLTEFEKTGVPKAIVQQLTDKIQGEQSKEIWLKESAFEHDTFITDATLIRKAKNISFVSLLDVYYSSAEGWLPVPSPDIGFDPALRTVTIRMMLGPGDKAFAALDPKLQKGSFPMKEPGLKILFNHRLRNSPLMSDDTPWYDIISRATIDKIYINVKATGVKNILLSNDDGLIDPNKKFFPFTGVPKVGSNFFIGSDEVFRKKLTGLTINVEWDGLPDDFKNQYEGYETPPPKNIEFVASVEKLVNAAWKALPVAGTNLELFTDPKTALDSSADRPLLPVLDWIIDELDDIGPEGTTFIDIPVLDQPTPLTAYNINSVQGFIRLVLQHRFYQQEYPFILANSAVNLGKFDLNGVKDLIVHPVTGVADRAARVDMDAVAADNTALDLVNGVGGTTAVSVKAKTQMTKVDSAALVSAVNVLKTTVAAAPVLPKPPYTPAIRSFHVEYTAAAAAADISMLHLYPFEDADHLPLPAPINNANLFPIFDNEGYLFIGISNANAGNNIALLFQLSEYSANPDIEAAVPEWFYLKENDWIKLRKDIDIVSDTTKGLLVSGIVTVALPWDANTQHTVLPSGYHWLRISAPSSTRAVCEAIAVSAQAAVAVFHNDENDLSRLSSPLPPNSIAGLLEPNSEIKKIDQPYPSFSGRMEENDAQFYRRVSERLRHKGRSITIFDFERLTLEAFPAVFKVKCIPHTKICMDKGEFIRLPAPGWVTLVVIPDITGYTAQTRLRPEVSRILLKEIEEYFLTKTSGFVKVQAINPRFQEANFRGNIKFIKGRDERYYINRLKSDVSNFLSPWLKGSSKNIVLGGTLMMSSVLKFVESQDYVSYVTDFVMEDNGSPVKAITASSPWKVLISGEQNYVSIQDEPAGAQPGKMLKII